MPITRDFRLEFDEQVYIDLHGERFARMLERPGTRAQFDEALESIRQLADPAACWDSFPIEKFLHEKIQLKNGIRIGGGPVVTVMGGSEELIVAVCTLGPRVDEGIRRFHQQGEMFKMIVLDELASWAIDQVREQLCTRFEEEAARRGWRASAPLSPGESTWPVTDQVAIFTLLDTEPIGVTLNESCLMYPIKSLSLAVGIGPGPLGVEGAGNCDFCTLRERCQYRRIRPGVTPAPA